VRVWVGANVARYGGPVAADDDAPFVEIRDGATTWRFERAFLESTWSCIWGRGCLGIEPEADEHRALGCCSVGAELATQDEAMLVSAMAAMIEPERFQHHAVASSSGVFQDDTRTNTRVVDGACIFLNRVGHEGGAGCALHLAALDAGESPIEWKPSVCWQLPIKVDWEPVDGDGGSSGATHDGEQEVATVRRWSRADWGEIGASMAWCCTEGDRAYQGEGIVLDTLADELAEVAGPEVYVTLRARLQEGGDRG
jgi:hypothetical protein